MDQWVKDLLQCPNCFFELNFGESEITCSNCHSVYQLVNQIPMLISEQKA